MKNHRGYLYGTIVLGVGTAVVKLIGALFKIPLTNILGGVGMSYFNVAYDLYYPLYALFISGVPVAVSKLVSENIACGKIQNARRILYTAFGTFLSAGALGTLAMFGGAEWFTALIDNPQAKAAVMALAPSLLLGCCVACLRGYWQGYQDMGPTAVSQIVEAIAKLLFGLWFSNLAMRAGMREFYASGTVYGTVCASAEQARLEVLPYGAAGAVLGVTVSAACGLLYLALCHGRSSRRSAAYIVNREQQVVERGLFGKLLRVAVPVCLASVISNLTSFIDLISVMNRLTYAIASDSAGILAQYAGAIPQGVGTQRLAAYLYGCYSGLAVPIYNLVPSLTAVIGISLLPAVSAARARGDTQKMSMTIDSSLRITGLIVFPAGLGIFALAEPILSLIFFSKPMEVAVIAPVLRVMGIATIFVALALPVNAALQAIGRADLPVKLLFMGGLLKLGCNFVLVGIPRLNIQAAPVGTLICYVVVFCCGFYALLDLSGVRLSAAAFGKPFLAGAGCALGAWLAEKGLSRVLAPSVSTLAAIAIGGGIFLLLVFQLRILRKEDILMLPVGEKFANLLEKHHLLG